MAFDAGSAVGKLILDDSQYTGGIDNAKKSNESLTKSIFTANLAYDAFKKVLGTTTQLIKQSITVSSDLQEANGKFSVVFKGVENSANAMRNSLTSAYGLSTLEATKALSSFQDLLVPMGLSRKAAANLSGEFSKLAVDLGSFNNVANEDVIRDLQSALVGNSETVKKYGIIINEAALKQEALNNGLSDNIQSLSEAEKAQLRYNIIVNSSKDAIGDFARTQESFANVSKQLDSVLLDIQANIGGLFLPQVTAMKKTVLEAAQAFNEMIKPKVSETLQKEQQDVEALIISLSRSNVQEEEREKLLTKLESINKDVADRIRSEGDENKNLKKILQDVNKEYINRILVQSNQEELEKALQKTAKQLLFVERNKLSLQKELTAEAKRLGIENLLLGETLQSQVDIVANQLEQTTDYTNALDTNLNRITSLKGSLDLVETSQRKYEQSLLDSTNLQQEAESIANALGIALTNLSDKNEEVEDSTKKTAEKTASAWSKAFEDMENAIGFSFEGIMGIAKQLESGITDMISAITDAFKSNLDQQIKDLDYNYELKNEKTDEQYEKEMEKLETKFLSEQEALIAKREAGLITEEEFNVQIKALEQKRAQDELAIDKKTKSTKEKDQKEYLKKKNALEKQAFESEKSTSIAEAWIDAASGIVAAWAGAISSLAHIPYVGWALAIAMGSALTAAMIGTAAAQTAAISQKQFVPMMATGGTTSGGPIIMNEAGGEIVNLPDGSLVIPNDISRQIAMNSGGMRNTNINVSFAGANITDNMSLNKITNHVITAMGRQLRLQS